MFSPIARTSACARSAVSKLFRNPSSSQTWHITPAARHLSTGRAAARSSTTASLHPRTFTTSRCQQHSSQTIGGGTSSHIGKTLEKQESATPTPATALAEVAGEPSYQQDPKMAIAFTCTVSECGHRQAHVFSKRSYERGIVIITCSGCKNRHLIADHLGWFENLTGEGSHVTIEQLVKAQGQNVTRGTVGENGVFEFPGEDPPSSTSDDLVSKS